MIISKVKLHYSGSTPISVRHLCRAHHREIHRCGDEESWWRNTRIDALAAARALWLETHPLPRTEAATANNEPTGGR